VDDNEDGKVSFAEAYAYTVIASRTIDIPLRASDRLLRVYSSLDPSIPIGQQNEVSEESSELKEESGDVGTMEDDDADDIPVKPARRSAVVLSGAIPELLRDSNQTTRRIAMALMKQLDVPEGADVSEVYRLQDELDAEDRASGGRGRSRWRSGRRQLLSLIGSRWEKLADRDQWRDYVVQLPAEECDSIFKEIQNLDGFGDYKKIREEARARIEKSQAKELQQVAFKRLIHHLELAVLEKNLPSCAIEEIQARYHAMVELENQSL